MQQIQHNSNPSSNLGENSPLVSQAKDPAIALLLKQLFDYKKCTTDIEREKELSKFYSGPQLVRDEWIARFSSQTPSDREIEDFYKNSKTYLYDLTFFEFTSKQSVNLFCNNLKSTFPAIKKILDYGCGCGRIGLELARRRYDVTLADFPNDTLAFCQFRITDEKLASAKTITLDNLKKHFEKYDIIIAFDLFEHMSKRQFAAALEFLRTKLSPKGRIIAKIEFGKHNGIHPMHYEFDSDYAKIINKNKI